MKGQHRPAGSEEELARRYRRWLLAYPATYRAERGDELIGVLLDRAQPEQVRPRPAEALDLVRGGLIARTRSAIRSPSARAWQQALAVITVVLPGLLALHGMRHLVVAARVLTSEDPALSWSWYRAAVIVDWPVRAAWLVVFLAVLLRLPRAAALLAAGAVAGEAWFLTTLVGGRSGWTLEAQIPWLALGVVAVMLLLRPTNLHDGLARIGRRPLLAMTAVLAGATAWDMWNRGRPDLLTQFAAIALVLVAAKPWRMDRVGWRIGVAALALLLVLRIESVAHRLFRDHHTTVADLAVELTICLAAPVMVVAVSALAADLASRTRRRLTTPGTPGH